MFAVLPALRRFASLRLLSWSLLGSSGFAAACSTAGAPSFGSGDSAGATSNSCYVGAPCQGGFCNEAGFCQAHEPGLSALLLEITPPADAGPIAGVRFTRFVDALGDEGESLDIELDHISHIEARVLASQLDEDACVPVAAGTASAVASDGTLAARLTLVPRERLLGLPNPAHSTEQSPGEDASYQLSLDVPPGSYDLYVEPLGADGDCERPPYLVLDQALAAGDVELELNLPTPQPLALVLRLPGYVDVLRGWTVDIVERQTGKVLSNRVVLRDPVGDDGGLEYSAALAFAQVEGDGARAATELVRLVPPDGVTAPTLYFERTVVELFQDGQALVDQLTSLPVSVAYTGRVNRKGTAKPAPGAVTLVATELGGISPGVVAAFSRTVHTDEEGVFGLDLLPGKYQVLLKPIDGDLSQTLTELTVSAGMGNQAGKVLEVGKRTNVAGSLKTASGAPVLGVPVEAYPPSVAVQLDVLSRARGALAIAPRAEVSGQASSGTFSLLADPGVFHVIARPETASGFAWGLRLGVTVEGADLGLADIVLLPPFVLEGRVTSGDIGPVPGALVRAYAYVSGQEFAGRAEDASSLVLVGEARVDESGRYRLLLPSAQ